MQFVSYYILGPHQVLSLIRLTLTNWRVLSALGLPFGTLSKSIITESIAHSVIFAASVDLAIRYSIDVQVPSGLARAMDRHGRRIVLRSRHHSHYSPAYRLGT